MLSQDYQFLNEVSNIPHLLQLEFQSLLRNSDQQGMECTRPSLKDLICCHCKYLQGKEIAKKYHLKLILKDSNILLDKYFPSQQYQHHSNDQVDTTSSLQFVSRRVCRCKFQKDIVPLIHFPLDNSGLVRKERLKSCLCLQRRSIQQDTFHKHQN